MGRSVGDQQFTPAAHLDSTDPAIFALHGTADEMCPYEDVGAFITVAQNTGIDAQLVTFEGASHFFAFNNPPARALALEQATALLARWR